MRWVDPWGLAELTFSSSRGTLTVLGGDGSRMSFPAGNNTTSRSGGPFPSGSFNFSHFSPHSGGDANSRFGSNGNFVFDVPGRTGMGVHSGRANQCDLAGRCGVEHATEGCIRTSDDATKYIKGLHQNGDPVRSITVKK